VFVLCNQNEKVTGGGGSTGWTLSASGPATATGDFVANGGTAAGWRAVGNVEIPDITVYVICAS
jgi:hypothetical protein